MAKRFDLAALAATDVPDSEPRAARSAGVTELPVDKIVANPLNQRSDVDEDADELEAMAETIRAHGLLQPLIVVTASAFRSSYPEQAGSLGDARWVALIGNRRLVAARRADLRQVPAIVNDGQLGSMYEVMLVENSHRRDLAPLREAAALRHVLDHEPGLSHRELGKRIGRTHTHVRYRLALLSLIPPLQRALDDGSLTVERAREVGEMTEEQQQAIADAGPPWRGPSGNDVSTPRPRRRALPKGDPAAAAASIREIYSGAELAELIRLLQSEDGNQPERSDSGGR